MEAKLLSSLVANCKVLNKCGVEYMLVGGVAVGFHGYQRISGVPFSGGPEIQHDIDLWYNSTNENYIRIISALEELGVEDQSLKDHIFDPQKTYLRIPFDTYRLEFLPQLGGLDSFNQCFERSESVEIDSVKILIIGLQDLIQNKKSVNREIDKQDIAQLKKINRQ